MIDLSITPTGWDCMGVRGGVAQDPAKGIGTLKPLTVPEIAGVGPAGSPKTDDAEGARILRAIHCVA